VVEWIARSGPTLHDWLAVAWLLFAIGVYGVLTRRNAVGILMALELCLNAGALQFVVHARHGAAGSPDGVVMALFIIAVAAAEVVVAMALLVVLFARRKTVDVTDLHGELVDPRPPPAD